MRINILLALCCAAALLWTGCAAKYQSLQPTTIRFDQPDQRFSDSRAEIVWQHHVLSASGNRAYARKEQENKVSLLAVRITNLGADTLRFPENFRIFSNADPLLPLSLAQTAEALRQTTAEDDDKAVEVDTGAGISIATGVFNAVRQVKANEEFVRELREYYLSDSYVEPGAQVVGLVGLPVKPGKPVRFVLDTLPE